MEQRAAIADIHKTVSFFIICIKYFCSFICTSKVGSVLFRLFKRIQKKFYRKSKRKAIEIFCCMISLSLLEFICYLKCFIVYNIVKLLHLIIRSQKAYEGSVTGHKEGAAC